jgi:hypothetical protein
MLQAFGRKKKGRRVEQDDDDDVGDMTSGGISDEFQSMF